MNTYRGFASSKETREKEKDPEVRYQKFMKNASKGDATSNGATTMSWGGGGAAGVSSSTGSGRGRGGMGRGGFNKGRKAVPPAWAQSKKEENED